MSPKTWKNRLMLSDIKKELLKSPDVIAQILEYYGYANIKIKSGYMSFGRDETSSPKSIVIRLDNNDWLYVKDYPKNINQDFFSYIINQRNITFQEIMKVTKDKLGIDDYHSHYEKRIAFGGFYNSMKSARNDDLSIKVYDKSILNVYPQICNLRFLKDNISLESQKFFDVRYDIENCGIVIPILDQVGDLIAVKERINREPEEDEQKYWYVVPGKESRTLYAYSQNYKYLVDNTVLIFESEKSCMQCYTYGIRNCVGLGSGTISKHQIKMIYELHPKQVFFLHDAQYEQEAILRNINAFKNYFRLSDIEVGYWNWKKRNISNKVSPSDLGKNELNKILNNEIEMV